MNNVAFAIGHIIVLQGFVRYAMRPESPQRVHPSDSQGVCLRLLGHLPRGLRSAASR